MVFTFSGLVLCVSSLVYLFIGTASLLNPQEALAPFNIVVTSIDGLNEIRATYGGMHIMFGIFFLAAACRRHRHLDALAVLSFYTGGLVIGRIISLYADGVPSSAVAFYLALESIALMASLACLAESKLTLNF